MDFEYYFENEEGWLHIHILPNEHIKGDAFMVEAWLEGDVSGRGGIYNYINKFMENPDIEEDEISGNSCEILLRRDYSTIRWNWYDEMPDSCTLPTQMLYEILQIWVAKKEELREERMKKEAEENI